MYIDDLVEQIIHVIENDNLNSLYLKVVNTHRISLGLLAKKIQSFQKMRSKYMISDVAKGFDRALYATYVSHLSPTDFSYKLQNNKDPRGNFSEILKIKNSGQISIFTAKVGVTRGNHYHNTKTEKFLVVHGEALIKFKNLENGQIFEKRATAENYEIIETIPGWIHKITNIGDTELKVIVWANEIFDNLQPDTVHMEF